MGLNDKTNTFTYLSVFDGSIVKKSTSDDPKAEKRVNKKGVDVWERKWPSLSGHLLKIETRDHEFGTDLNLVMKDGGESFLLQIPLNSGYANAFLRAIQNANFKEQIELCPKVKEVDNKKRATMFVNQNGKGLKWFYTKAEPKDLPPMVQIKVKGQLTWDNSDQMEFFKKMIEEKINPQLSGNEDIHYDTSQGVDHSDNQETIDPLPEDDLPF